MYSCLACHFRPVVALYVTAKRHAVEGCLPHSSQEAKGREEPGVPISHSGSYSLELLLNLLSSRKATSKSLSTCQ